MSFGDLERGYGSVGNGGSGGGGGGGGGFQASGRGGDQEYIRLNEAVRSNIGRFSDYISQYRKLADQMGTPKDTADLRQRVYALLPARTCARARLHTHDARHVARVTGARAPRRHDVAEDSKAIIASITNDIKLLGRIDGGTPSENVRRRALPRPAFAMAA